MNLNIRTWEAGTSGTLQAGPASSGEPLTHSLRHSKHLTFLKPPVSLKCRFSFFDLSENLHLSCEVSKTLVEVSKELYTQPPLQERFQDCVSAKNNFYVKIL